MVRYDFNPVERHEVLRCKSNEKRQARFIETVQFKALIVQQMQLKTKGSFPIKELFLLHGQTNFTFPLRRALRAKLPVAFMLILTFISLTRSRRPSSRW